MNPRPVYAKRDYRGSDWVWMTQIIPICITGPGRCRLLYPGRPKYCKFYQDGGSLRIGRKYPGCVTWVERIRQFIAEGRHIQVVYEYEYKDEYDYIEAGYRLYVDDCNVGSFCMSDGELLDLKALIAPYIRYWCRAIGDTQLLKTGLPGGPLEQYMAQFK